MHVDNNTRGSNQTAMRTLDPGGGLLICKAILFRTSLVWLCGQLVVPWGLDSMVFRFMRWDHEGAATIEELPVVAFYALVEDYREANYGTLDVCLLDLKGGVAMASPNHTVGEATALPSVASDLMPVSFDQLCWWHKPRQPPHSILHLSGRQLVSIRSGQSSMVGSMPIAGLGTPGYAGTTCLDVPSAMYPWGRLGMSART